MTRISTTIMVFLILLNSSAAMMEASGLYDDLGVKDTPGAAGEINQTVDDAKEGFSPSQGPISTLFGMFVSALKSFEVLIQIVFAGPSMFMNLGFPAWIVTPIFAPMYLIVVLEFIYVAAGRDLI